MSTGQGAMASAPVRSGAMLIAGQWVQGREGRTLTVENPARRQPVAEVPRGGPADVDAAVAAAARAFESWKRVAPRERGRLLLEIADSSRARPSPSARRC